MANRTGVNAPKAVEILATLGHDRAQIAADRQAQRSAIARAIDAIEKRPVRSPFRSITREVDPFALVQDTQLRQAQEIEEVFN